MLRIERLTALANGQAYTTLKLVLGESRSSQSGYSLIGVLVALVVTSILLSVFVSNVSPMLNKATELNVQFTAKGLAASAGQIRQIWRVRGQPNHLHVVLADQEKGRDIWVSQYGWPLDTQPVNDVNNFTTVQCVRVWNALLDGKKTKVVVDKIDDSNIFLAISTADGCRYEYWAPRSQRDAVAIIEYRPNQYEINAVINVRF